MLAAGLLGDWVSVTEVDVVKIKIIFEKCKPFDH